MEQKNTFNIPASILGASLIVASLVGAIAFYNARALSNTLSVTGSAKEAVKADSARWNGSFSRTIPLSNLKGGYALMKKDETAIMAFMKTAGFNEADVVISPVYINPVYKMNGGAPDEYELRQNVEVRSSDIEKMTATAKNVTPLVDQGVIFSAYSVEYYISNLPELRVKLLGNALLDAKARAESIAGSTKNKVGELRSASSGVVQVMSPNSINIDDYGSYDTSSPNKEVMVTVKAAFTIK